MELKCEKCERIFDKQYSFGQHKRYCNIDKFDIIKLQEEYDNGLSKLELVKKYKIPYNFLCEKIKSRTLSESNKLAHKKFPESFKHSEETKEKQRQSRFDYLKLKTGNTPWDRRQRGEMSYLENWFKEVILKYKLQAKYDIVYNYAEYPYFLDFAFVNIKLAIELDGKCHFKNGHERIQHDIDRDKILVEKGWSVYRIKYDQINEETIKEFLTFISDENNVKPKVYGNNLYKYSEIKEKKKDKERKDKKIIIVTREEYFQDRADKYLKSQIKYVDLLLKSEIDFNKWGWVNQVSLIIKQKPQKVKNWMQKIMPEFYDNCFKRK